MPKIYQNVGGAWKTVTKIYQNIGGSWKNVVRGYVNVGGIWKLFWPAVQTPYPSGSIYIRDYLDINNIDNDIYIANVGDTIYGHRGPTWVNSPTAYQYRWQYAYYSGDTLYNFSPAQTSTAHPTPLDTSGYIDAWDDLWIVYQVRAQNSFGWSEWFSSANEAHLVKYPPENIDISITGTPSVGSVLTAVSHWDNTLFNTNDQSPSAYEYTWYWDDTGQLVENTGSFNTYTVKQSDYGHDLRVNIEASNSGGSTFASSPPVTVIIAPGPFNVTSVIKGLSNGTTRPVTTTWTQSANADRYEVQIQRRYSGQTTWVTVQTFDQSSYTNEPTRTVTYNVSPVARDYRVSVRARAGFDLATAAYSDGGTLASPVYVEAVGIAPSAPTSLSAGSITTTSATISFTAPTSSGSDSLSFYEWSTNNSTWTSSGTSTSPVYVYGLTSNTYYTVYIRATNADGVAGPAGSVSFYTTTAPGAFNITSVTKAAYNSSLTLSQGANNNPGGTGGRQLSISWQQSTNADRYEVQVEARDYDPVTAPGSSQTWLVLRTLNEASYVYEPTRTETYNAAFYWKYRVTARARSGNDLDSAAYSNGGSSISYAYVEATGIAPNPVSVGSASSITYNSASVSYTLPTYTGTAPLARIEYSLDQSTWTQTFSSPISLTGLSGSTNYYLYMRTYNADGLVSSVSNSPMFTTPAGPPVNTALPGISTDTGNYSAGSIITGTQGTWTGASSYTIELAYATTTPVPSNSSTRANTYTITNSDASDPSYYYATKVTAYSGAGQTGSSAVAFSSTSSRSTITPSVGTPTVSAATSNGFTITWTSGPANYHTSDVLIYNTSDTLVSTQTNKTSPFAWTGGSGGTTYYAKVKVKSTDSDATSVTSSASTNITTSTAFVTPTFGGSLPTWAATGANGSNFQRIASPTSIGWGWNNGTQTWSGSFSSRGWNFRQNSGSTGGGTSRSNVNITHRTTNSPSRQIYSTSYFYIAASNITTNDANGAAAVTWYASPTYGSIRATSFGTDNTRYFSTNVSSWI